MRLFPNGIIDTDKLQNEQYLKQDKEVRIQTIKNKIASHLNNMALEVKAIDYLQTCLMEELKR